MVHLEAVTAIFERIVLGQRFAGQFSPFADEYQSGTQFPCQRGAEIARFDTGYGIDRLVGHLGKALDRCGEPRRVEQQSRNIAELDFRLRKVGNRPDQCLQIGVAFSPAAHRLVLLIAPDIFVGQEGENRREDQEDQHRPASCLALLHLRFGRPDQEGRDIPRHLFDRRLRTVCIGH